LLQSQSFPHSTKNVVLFSSCFSMLHIPKSVS
jgi:hypothetical protein